MFPSEPCCTMTGTSAAIAFALRVQKTKRHNKIRLAILTIVSPPRTLSQRRTQPPLAVIGKRSADFNEIRQLARINGETPECRKKKELQPSGIRQPKTAYGTGTTLRSDVGPGSTGEPLERPAAQRLVEGESCDCAPGPGAGDRVSRQSPSGRGLVHD